MEDAIKDTSMGDEREVVIEKSDASEDGQTVIPVKKKKDKNLYTAVELLAMVDEENNYLVKPIFPQVGTAVLVGRPDCGKSQFARQFCIELALGENSFLNLPLTPVHKRSIYVTTEDGIHATQNAVKKQFTGLSKEGVESVKFLIADILEQEEIIKSINEELKENPADLVVIDSFGDIFKGWDSNNNMAMRNTVKLFDKIAKKHNCLILFVHHINKAGYKQSPSQEHVQGGGGLTQKVRLAIQLSDAPGNKRYLSVIKGNYCPKLYKENSLVLDFNEDTLLFVNTGSMISTGSIGTQKDDDHKVKDQCDLEELANKIFSSSDLSYGEYVDEYYQVTGKKSASANRDYRELLKFGIIEKHDRKYRLKTDINIDLEE